MKEKLIGKTLEELRAVASEMGLPRFTASQLARWLYVDRVRSVDEMTNISLAGRARLSERYEVGVTPYSMVQESVDGTKKYLFPVEGLKVMGAGVEEGVNLSEVGVSEGGKKNVASAEGGVYGPSSIETVMIPSENRHTICVSSQSGCRMACRFCMTGRQGFHGNLSATDIISQFLAIDESDSLTNAVFMGMGEPFDNYENVLKAIEILTSDWGFGWSPKRITVSTIGIMPGLRQFLDGGRCHLAISLHSPFPLERQELMPAKKLLPAAETIRLLRQYDFTGQRRVSFEYIMFGGLNDSRRHADELSRMLKGLECRVNLIRFHKIPDAPYESSSETAIEAFRSRLEHNGVVVTVRASRGEDIFAACGMLAGKHRQRGKNPEMERIVDGGK